MDLLVRADELGVSEGVRAFIGTLLFNISVLSVSQALRAHVYSTKVRCDLAIRTLQFSSEISGVAVDRFPRETSFLFGGQFLNAVGFGHFNE